MRTLTSRRCWWWRRSKREPAPARCQDRQQRAKLEEPGDFPLLAEDRSRQSPVRLTSPGFSWVDPPQLRVLRCRGLEGRDRGKSQGRGRGLRHPGNALAGGLARPRSPAALSLALGLFEERWLWDPWIAAGAAAFPSCLVEARHVNEVALPLDSITDMAERAPSGVA